MPDVRPNGTGRAPRGGASRKAPKTSSRSQIEKALKEQTAAVGVLFQLRGDDYPALVMQHVGPDWAKAMADAAEESPQLKRLLTLATQGGVAGAALISTAMLVAPILAYYDMPLIPKNAREGIAVAQLQFISDEEVGSDLVQAWRKKHPDERDAME